VSTQRVNIVESRLTIVSIYRLKSFCNPYFGSIGDFRETRLLLLSLE
jgi:hypothetical protein